MIKVLLLGSTGSIGKSTENCIRRYRDDFQLVGLSVNRRVEDAKKQLEEFDVSTISIGDIEAYKEIKNSVGSTVTVLHGDEGLLQMAEELEYDVLVNALVGSVGFAPTVAALKRGKKVALANKESLVVGGEIIRGVLDQYGGTLVPIDSEHSAILQCLVGEDEKSVESLTITASGGPFRELPADEFKNITVKTALAHPTWAMGPKITIDSSTLMNKGFEIIEAHYLFDIAYEDINVVVHPQSIIHSMVTFKDGAVMAQCGLPDMELPIQYALTYPKRLPIESPRLSLAEIGSLTFFEPKRDLFPCLDLCIEAGKIGGTVPAVLNASNEVAVELFLKEKIAYTDISKIVSESIESHNREDAKSLEQILAVDKEVRRIIRDKYDK